MAISKKELDEYIEAYSRGEAKISDEEYDVLLEEYLKENGEDKRPFLRQKQSDAVNRIVGTIHKVYGVTEPMRPNQKVYKDWAMNLKLPEDTTIIVQPKFDGVSVSVDLMTREFYTRGDYDNGESVNVSELFKDRFTDGSLDCFHEIVTAVKFEAIMSHETFNNLGLNNKYKRPRDAVAGIISSRNTELSKCITLIPLREYVDVNNNQYITQYLADNSIKTTLTDYTTIQGFIDDILADGATCVCDGMHYSLDGVVVDTLSDDNSFGNEIAIKILNMVKETKLIDVKYQFGKQGRITPVAVVEPVCFDNVTVTNITLSTLDRIAQMGLKYGDTVRIMYNIVPYLIDSLHDGSYPVRMPTECPICGSKFDLQNLNLIRCTNPDCPGLILGSIIRYCEQMKMFGLSKGMITKLYEYDMISSISDLYKLEPDQLSELPGFKSKLAHKIVKSIREASQLVPLSRWLGALPIRDTSAKTWQLIIDETWDHDEMKASNAVKYYLTENGDVEEFMRQFKMPVGVGYLKVVRIAEGLRQNWEEMKKCIDYVTFNCLSSPREDIKGVVTFTGIRDMTLEDALINRGYKVDSFSKKTTVLIVPDRSFVSSKVKKAEALNIPIYTIDEAYKVLLS